MLVARGLFWRIFADMYVVLSLFEFVCFVFCTDVSFICVGFKIPKNVLITDLLLYMWVLIVVFVKCM